MPNNEWSRSVPIIPTTLPIMLKCELTIIQTDNMRHKETQLHHHRVYSHNFNVTYVEI